MVIDLDTPRFSQSQVLRILPDLKAKQLQNWNQRGTLDEGEQRPGRGKERLYRGGGVIMLDFMQRVVDYGLPPASAAVMASEYSAAAYEFLENEPEVITRDNGGKWIKITPEIAQAFRRGFIVRIAEAEYSLLVEGDVGFQGEGDRLARSFGIQFELDYHVAMAVNRILMFENGEI